MREANDRGYECLLVEDATASSFPAFKQATLEMSRAQGALVGWTASADHVLAPAWPRGLLLQQASPCLARPPCRPAAHPTGLLRRVAPKVL